MSFDCAFIPQIHQRLYNDQKTQPDSLCSREVKQHYMALFCMQVYTDVFTAFLNIREYQKDSQMYFQYKQLTSDTGFNKSQRGF